jgi:hypothetical protein
VGRRAELVIAVLDFYERVGVRSARRATLRLARQQPAWGSAEILRQKFSMARRDAQVVALVCQLRPDLARFFCADFLQLTALHSAKQP